MNRLLPTIGLVAVAAVFAVGGALWLRQHNSPADAEPSAVDDHPPTGLHLHPVEMKAAGIEFSPIRQQTVKTTRTLPGRIAYDATKHVAVVAVEEGVVESVLVNTGESVKAGQTLAVMRCPGVGTARSELISHESAMQLAKREYEWNAEVADSVEALLTHIENRTPVEEIERSLAGRRVGAKRASLLSAYSQLLLAERLSQSASDAGGADVLGGRVISERRSKAEQASATLLAEAEQTLFEARQASDSAKSAFEEAQRRVGVARQELATMLGMPLGECSNDDLLPAGDNLTVLNVRSPIDGTIERREYSATERVPRGGELFVVADTNTLWVEADIRGGDWAELFVREGDAVQVTTPATGDRSWQARVVYIGREVDAVSGAAPLVAELDNSEGKLRPGLFARIEAPTSPQTDALVVPSAAVVDLDGSPAVFIAEGEGFKPVEVTVGRQFGDLVEIDSPLAEGSQVVSAGAFFLKSELLLAGEE